MERCAVLSRGRIQGFVNGGYQRMRKTIIVLTSLLATAAFAAEPAPEFNLKTDAILFTGATSLLNSDQVRWDIYVADSAGGRSEKNVGGSYDATYEAKLAPGKYVAVAGIGGISREYPFEVREGATTELLANFEAAQVTFVPKRSPESKAAEPEARIEVTQGNFKQGIYGQKQIYVPAGDLTLTGRIGPTSIEEKLTVRAGETTQHEVIIPSGVVVAKAIYREGGEAVAVNDVRFDALSTQATLEGEHETIDGVYGVDKVMDMPAGDYIMRARLGHVTKEAPFTVTAGQRTDITINIDAGVLAVSAPGAERIDISEITKDIQGKQQEISGRYSTAHQETLHPGEYSVKVSYDRAANKDPKEVKATVKAGERTEITVE
jgi:hypothetical protein